MTAAGYSRSRGIPARRLEYWKKRLTPGVSDIEFVPVALPAARSATIDVVIGDVVVRVDEASDVERVARLVIAIARGRAC